MLVEAAANDGWQGGELKRLHNILGPVFEYAVNEDGDILSGDGASSSSQSKDGKTRRRDRTLSPRDRSPRSGRDRDNVESKGKHHTGTHAHPRASVRDADLERHGVVGDSGSGVHHWRNDPRRSCGPALALLSRCVSAPTMTTYVIAHSLHHHHRRRAGRTQYLIGTTKLLTGDTFIEPLIEEMF